MNIFRSHIPTYLILLSFITFFGCKHERQDDVEKYHQLVNDAELAICEGEYRVALDNYGIAFRKIKRPFGKDLYNAALAAQASEFRAERDQYLQQLIDGSEDIAILKAIFLSNFMTVQEWKILEGNRVRAFNESLREEMEQMKARDQQFRPDYDNYDDTINAIRSANLKGLLQISETEGFPSQIEIGYSENLRAQPHHLVLHHTAQRRSYDKSISDLEPTLRQAVTEGRLDPELAIRYLKYQDDQEKGKFEVYATWQYRHTLLPDSMSSSLWVPAFSRADLTEINELRSDWYANSIQDIQTKARYMEETSWPFIFTSVQKSVAELAEESTPEEAVEQYLLFTDGMKRVR